MRKMRDSNAFKNFKKFRMQQRDNTHKYFLSFDIIRITRKENQFYTNQ